MCSIGQTIIFIIYCVNVLSINCSEEPIASKRDFQKRYEQYAIRIQSDVRYRSRENSSKEMTKKSITALEKEIVSISDPIVATIEKFKTSLYFHTTYEENSAVCIINLMLTFKPEYNDYDMSCCTHADDSDYMSTTRENFKVALRDVIKPKMDTMDAIIYPHRDISDTSEALISLMIQCWQINKHNS